MDKENLLRFFSEVIKLKELKRSGWSVSGIEDGESIADHSFMTALMVLILGSERKLDIEKALKMAIIHDIAESKTGDVITWRDYQKTRKVKEMEEAGAMKELLSLLGTKGKDYLDLWNEYEEAKTPEARFVKAVDKIELIFQALKYDNTKKNIKPIFESFFVKNEVPIDDKELSEFADLILKSRKK